MTGRDRHPARVVSDQIEEALPDLGRGMPIVDQRQDAVGLFPLHADQIGDAMDQNPGLAGPWTGQDQHIGLLPIIRHDPRLGGVVQSLHDAAPGFGRGLAPQLLSAARQPFLDEPIPVEREVILRELQGVRHRSKALFRIRGHDMGLESLFLVMQFQRLEVWLGEEPLARLQVNGHGGPEDGQALAQGHDTLFVQPEKGAVEEFRRIGCQRGELDVAVEGRHQRPQRRLDLDVLSARVLGCCLLEQRQQDPSCQPADLGRHRQRLPRPLKPDRQMLPIDLSNLQAADAVTLVSAVARDPTDQLVDDVRTDGRMACIPQFLRGDLQVEHRGAAKVEIRCQFLEFLDQVLFEAVGVEKTFFG
jgi:hypothetical protein